MTDNALARFVQSIQYVMCPQCEALPSPEVSQEDRVYGVVNTCVPCEGTGTVVVFFDLKPDRYLVSTGQRF